MRTLRLVLILALLLQPLLTAGSGYAGVCPEGAGKAPAPPPAASCCCAAAPATVASTRAAEDAAPGARAAHSCCCDDCGAMAPFAPRPDTPKPAPATANAPDRVDVKCPAVVYLLPALHWVKPALQPPGDDEGDVPRRPPGALLALHCTWLT